MNAAALLLIDLGELDKVLSGWGNMSAEVAAATTAVPEPSAASVLAIGLAAAAALLRRSVLTG